MGWCTHGVTGQATPYATAYGYPAWSRECKSTSGSSGAEAGSRTVTGDDSSVGGSGEGLPLEGRAFTSYRRPHPRASSDRGGAVDGSSSLSAPGREGRTEVTGAAQFPLGLESLPRSMKRPRHPVALEEELEHASPEVVAGEEPEAPPINPSALVPVIDLSRLSPSDLATHLSDVARLEVAMPPSSPRLRAVLGEYGVGLHECGPNPPFTLCQAAHCVDEAAFGRKTPRVLNACVAAWHIISSAEALARSVSRKFLAEEQGGYPPAPRSEAGSEATTMAPAESLPLVLDEAWSKILPAKPRKGRALPRSDLLGPLWQSSQLTSSKEIEANERHIAGAQLLALLPGFIHHSLVSLSEGEWLNATPFQRETLLRTHFGAFSPGSVSGARRALTRLLDWLALNQMEHCFTGSPPWLEVSGGLLSLFVMDEQEKSSRGSQGGSSVPSSLRAGLAWAAAHAGCSGLAVRADVFLSAAAPSPAIARQAVSVSLRVFSHLRWLRVNHTSPHVKLYAAGFELLCVASLRMRDAQRAVLEFVEDVRIEGDGKDLCGFLKGVCYSSKHPKRRSPKKKFFFAPLRAGCGDGGPDGYVAHLLGARERLNGASWDYIFPRLSAPRGGDISSVDAAFLPGPASSTDAIRHLRTLLCLPPLSLTREQAASFSGHSGRHFLVTLAKSIAHARSGDKARYNNDELALLGDWLEASMVSRYSSEQYQSAKLELISRLVVDADKLLELASLAGRELPFRGGWGQLAGLLPAAPTYKVHKAAPTGDIAPEDSDSDSSDNSDDEDQ
jgi:hypothetical protein